MRIVRSTLRHVALVAAVCLATVSPSFAETLTGVVVGLADGDTVTVLDAEEVQHKVRLAGIDAPEKRQPFGDRSRQHLASLVFRKQVVVQWHKTDRYGRIVGKVLVGGLDAGLEQVKAGLAWHYIEYAREQTPSDRGAYADAEASARASCRGLWQQPDAVPPWEFRRQLRATVQSKPRDASSQMGLDLHRETASAP